MANPTRVLVLTLTSICSGPSVRHRDGEGTIMTKLSDKLILEFTSPDRFAAGAIAKRIARLQHEALDDAMENHVVIVSVLGMAAKVFHRSRDCVGEKSDVYVSLGRSEDGLTA